MTQPIKATREGDGERRAVVEEYEKELLSLPWDRKRYVPEEAHVAAMLSSVIMFSRPADMGEAVGLSMGWICRNIAMEKEKCATTSGSDVRGVCVKKETLDRKDVDMSDARNRNLLGRFARKVRPI